MAESGTPTPDSVALGEKLRLIRTRRKLSLEQVSELLSELGHPLAPTVLSRTERGRRDLRAVEVAALSRVYGVEASEILSALAPDWEVARAEERMQQARAEVGRAIYGFVDALAHRWKADPSTLTLQSAGIPPVIAVDDEAQYAAMRGVLEQLGISGAVSLVLHDGTDEDEVSDA